MANKNAFTEEIPVLSANPSNPSSGWVKLFYKSDGYIYALDSAGVATPIGLWGTKRVASNATARTTTTSSTYQTKTSLSTGAVDTTYTYRIDFSAILDSATANRSMSFRIINTTDNVVLYEATPMRTSFATQRIPVGGFVTITFGSTIARTIALQFNSVDNTSTIGIQQAFLDFYRVA